MFANVPPVTARFSGHSWVSCLFPLTCAAMNTNIVKTRFAPSPTGLIHLGNVRTALFNYLLAQRYKGQFLLRLEDTDEVRSEEKFEQALQEDLAWLSLNWHEGPEIDGGNGPYWQSERASIYKKYFDKLIEQKQAYPCFCTEHELKLSRKAQLASGKPPRYSGKCRGLNAEEIQKKMSAGLPSTLRFHVADDSVTTFEDKVRGYQEYKGVDIGDFIIRRSEGTPAFFFCNAVDDALMKVSLVVRGEDHLTNTPRQLMILKSLGLPEPEYAHISLVVGHDGAPLSKRHGSKTVRELRENGFMPLAIVNYLARLGHTFENNSFMSLEELSAAIEIKHLHKSPARFDAAQLSYWQKEAIQIASDEELSKWAKEHESVLNILQNLVPDNDSLSFINAVRDNIVMPEDVSYWAEAIYSKNLSRHKDANVVIKEAGTSFFEKAVQVLPENKDEFKKFAKAVGATTGKKGKELFMPLRAALTGTTQGPEMAKMWSLIGFDQILARLEAGIKS